MNWKKLLSKSRLNEQNGSQPQTVGRTRYQKDFDRVVFSSAFRRLQNKTQVVPLPEKDFIHTRLTHSIETSCVGRSLGFAVGDYVLSQSGHDPDLPEYHPNDFADITAAACLAHDIGNPPFGHAGEDAISHTFRNDPNAAAFLDPLSRHQQNDLCNFEGNASGFRLLTRTSPSQSELTGGLRLTAATLGTFSKYPKPSLPDLSSTGRISEKKYGYFQSESRTFRHIAGILGLRAKQDQPDCWSRHPLAFLVEASDDICYTIIDFEDGYKMDLIGFEEIETLFLALIDQSSRFDAQKYQRIRDQREQIGYLRALCIQKLVHDCTHQFKSHYAQIMNGEFEKSLLSTIPGSDVLRDISKKSVDIIYRHPLNVEIEIAGYKVIGGLLNTFLEAVLGDDSGYNRKIRHLLPLQFQSPDVSHEGRYETILRVVEYICRMTDRYAMNLYRRLNGVSMPA